MAVAVLAVVGALCGQVAEQPSVYVYHDPGWFHAGYFNVPKSAEPLRFHALMSEALVDELGRRGVAAEVIDAAGWARICAEGRRCIVVDIAQSVPAAVYRGEDDGSPLETWLEGGGILCYAGDWLCHWYALEGGGKSGEGALHQGDDDVLDADLVRDGFVGISCEPTDAAWQVLPQFEGWRTLRPFDAAAVADHCEWYEVYGAGARQAGGETLMAADPVAFRVPGGDGYVFGCRFDRSAHTDSAQMVLDFILNRGLDLLAGED